MENKKLITKNWLIGIGFEHGIWPHNFTLGNRDEEGFIVYNIFNKTISFNHCIIPSHLIEYQHDLLDMIEHLKTQKLIKNKYDKDVYSRKARAILKDSKDNG